MGLLRAGSGLVLLIAATASAQQQPAPTYELYAVRYATISHDGRHAGHCSPTNALETGLAPGEDQDYKGDQQRENGSGHDKGERQREVAPRRDPMQWYEHGAAEPGVNARSRSQ